MNSVRLMAAVMIVSCTAVLSGCDWFDRNVIRQFEPLVPSDGMLLVRNRTAADTVTGALVDTCNSTALTNRLDAHNHILPAGDWAFRLAAGCHRLLLLEREDTIARRGQLEINVGDTVIVVLRPRS